MERRIPIGRGRPRTSPGGGDADRQAAQRTDRLLRRLAARDWAVVSGVDERHGVEHVLVGPGGVLALTSRQPEGVGAARVKDGMLWLRRGVDPRADRSGAAINRQALDSARSLQKEIASRAGGGGAADAGPRPEVQPVVVLWCEFPQAVAESPRIAFVRGRDLLDWVSHRPRRLDQAGCARMAATVRAIAAGGDRPRSWRAAVPLRGRRQTQPPPLPPPPRQQGYGRRAA